MGEDVLDGPHICLDEALGRNTEQCIIIQAVRGLQSMILHFLSWLFSIKPAVLYTQPLRHSIQQDVQYFLYEEKCHRLWMRTYSNQFKDVWRKSAKSSPHWVPALRGGNLSRLRSSTESLFKIDPQLGDDVCSYISDVLRNCFGRCHWEPVLPGPAN
jgi:hypothetical protein